MSFKINIGTKEGKTYKLESEAEGLMGKEVGEKINGSDISPDFQGYEFQISGASDNAGFPALEGIEGVGLKKILLTYGKGMQKQTKREGKKKRGRNRPKGLRLRKTIRGSVISNAITQINLKLLKEGSKKISEIFPSEKAPAEAQ